MESNKVKSRTILVYLNSPLKIETTVKYWGELQKILVEEYSYDSNIVGISPKTNEIYETLQSVLPEGDCSINIIVTKTSYGY